MLSTSFEFRSLIAQNSKTEFMAKLTLADDTVKWLYGDDVMAGSATFSDAVSSDGNFDIGAAIINRFDVTLNNYDRRFDDYDFTNAIIVPYIGVRKSNGAVEWLRKGTYGVDQPESYGNTIGLSALDDMRKFERPYSDVATTYPATLSTIARDICLKCGVALVAVSFTNSNYKVRTRPEDEALTCLEMIAYIAQVSGNYARIYANGSLGFNWYNTAAFEAEDWLDGEEFDDAKPYASGDTADGGNFTDYTSGVTVDGGEFGANVYASIHAISNATIVTDDVVITGISVKAQDEVTDDNTQGEEGETALYGTAGYVLSVEDNPLILYGEAANVAALIGPRVVGMRFRPFDLSAVGDPAIEAGDPVIITDRLQNQYRSYITSLTYKVGNYEAFSCGAETPSRNSATSFSALTKAVVKARNALKQEKTAREQAIEHLADELANSSGLYMTSERQSDGSNVYYMHDKPTLRESQIIWKLTANAFGISTDGGKTYPYGLDVNGDAILNRIYAIGLDANYIDTGRITVKKNYQTMFSADIDTGEVYINADTITMGSEKLTTAINGIKAVYGTCSSAQATTAKVVSCSNFALRTGAVVNVKFSSANTATNPTLNVNNTGAKLIRVNGANITSDYYWGAGSTVTFVYDGTYWNVADSGTLAKIKATNERITSTVSNYYSKSEIDQTLNNISLSVTNAKLGSSASIVISANGKNHSQTLDLTGVRNAFKNDTTSITISAGTVTFNSNTFIVNSTYFKVTSTGVITATSGTIGGFTITSSSIYNSKLTIDSRGMTLKKDNTLVGSIGTNNMLGYSNQRGLTFDLEATGNYMAWSAKSSSSDSAYTIKLLYANRSTDGYVTGRLSVSCNLDLKNFKAYNFWIDPNSGGASGGVNCTMRFVQVLSVNSNGIVTNWGSNAYLTFKNGLVTDISYYS